MSRMVWILLACCAFGQSIAEKTRGMERMEGFFPIYWDAKAGKIWIEISRWNDEFIYLNSLPAGIGSNDIGLDRGQLGGTRAVRFERSGPKVLLVERNYGFRATSDNPDERRAVEEAFAQSVVWGGEVAAEDNRRALVDATSLYLRDAHGVAARLARAQQGGYKLDLGRSAFYLARTKNFPGNTEVEVTLTFASDDPKGAFIRSVAASPEAVTVREHHSFVALPEPGYKPRLFDPRAGYFGISFMDFAAPIPKPIRQRYISRHRTRPGLPIT